MKPYPLLFCCLMVTAGVAETPKDLSEGDWSSIRAAYEAGRHQFFQQPDGSHTARNPGLGWKMTFDEAGFTATPENGAWTWGLELEGEVGETGDRTLASAPTGGLVVRRSAELTEWFINDQRGLEQGWTLSAPAEIRLRVRGNLKATVSEQSVRFGDAITYSGLKAWDATGKIIPTRFEATAEGFAVCYDDRGAQYPLTIDPIAQNAYLKASNTGGGDNFGNSVAVSGDTVVVGAPSEDSNAKGVNQDDDDDNDDTGAAYVFTRSGSGWSQQAYLKASNTGASDVFGYSVAVSGDTVVVGANGEDSNAKGVNGDQADNSAGLSGAAYVFRGLGVVLPSLSRTGPGAPGAADLSYTTPGFPAVNEDGRVLFDHGLSGAGAAGGGNRGLFSTLAPANTVDLIFQSGSPLAGIGGFGLGNKVTALGAPLCNQLGRGLFLATASGPGVTSANNRVLLRDDGNFVASVLRTGQAVPELGGAQPSAFSEVLQSLTEDLIAIPYKLKTSAATTPAVTSTNDSGMLLLNHAGDFNDQPREGDLAYCNCGTFGQFSGRAANGVLPSVLFGAFFIPTPAQPVAQPVAALFVDSDNGSIPRSRIAAVGDTAPEAVPATATFSSFPALTTMGGVPLFRAKLKGAAASANEGIWLYGGATKVLLVLKGADLASAGLPDVRIGSIVRFWPVVSGSSVVVQVTLTGSGVTAANRSALLLRQRDGNYLVLLRTGDRAPGAGPATVLAIQAVDVNPRSGHYAVLGSLKGAKSSDNQALWAGQTALGDVTNNQFQALPSLRLRKGERYLSTATPLGTIKGLSIKPAVDPTGAGGRGLAQVVGSSGHIAVSILTDGNVTEQVLLGP